MTLRQSLWLKFLLLAAAVGCVLALGWPADDWSVPGPSQIVVVPDRPSGGAPKATPLTGLPARSAPRHPARLDLNRATSEQLQQLPGIGEALARRVVQERDVHGTFRSVDDLLTVKGIGPRRLERLRPLLSAEPRPAGARPGPDAKRGPM